MEAKLRSYEEVVNRLESDVGSIHLFGGIAVFAITISKIMEGGKVKELLEVLEELEDDVRKITKKLVELRAKESRQELDEIYKQAAKGVGELSC